MLRLHCLGYLVIFLVTMGMHPAQAGCRTIWRGLKSRVQCDPIRLPNLGGGGGSGGNNGSSTYVYTEKYYEFTIHNTAVRTSFFDINGSSFSLGPGESKFYKFKKAYGTNGDNVQYYPEPVIKLNSGSTAFRLGSHPDEYIVDNGNGRLSLQPSKPIAKAQPEQSPQPNYRPYPQPANRQYPQPGYPPYPQPANRQYPQPGYSPYPQPPYHQYPQPSNRPYAGAPMGSLCFTNSMRCVVGGLAPTGTPCTCVSPYGPSYGQIVN